MQENFAHPFGRRTLQESGGSHSAELLCYTWKANQFSVKMKTGLEYDKRFGERNAEPEEQYMGGWQIWKLHTVWDYVFFIVTAAAI